MAGVVHVPWYATVLRQELLARALADIAPIALRYGATRYAVHRSQVDFYMFLQMAWFDSKIEWYNYWAGPEMVQFRRRHSGHFQVPITYVWNDELAAGALVPEVALEPGPDPRPAPAPQT